MACASTRSPRFVVSPIRVSEIRQNPKDATNRRVTLIIQYQSGKLEDATKAEAPAATADPKTPATVVSPAPPAAAATPKANASNTTVPAAKASPIAGIMKASPR